MQGHKTRIHQANLKYHNRIASRYDDIYPADDPYWKFYREITWRNLKKHLPRLAGAIILDLGCGTGEWGIRFLKSGFQVTFVDLSQGMIEAAKRRAAREAPRGKASFVQADLVDLSSLPASHYDFATAQGDPLSICSNPLTALRGIRRVLKPEAFFVASLDNRCAYYDHYLEKRDFAGLEKLHRKGEAIWLARRPEERFPVHTFDPDGVRKLFARAGFQVVQVIGKTILPVRKFPALLREQDSYRKLLRMEEELHGREAYLGRASHLQVAAHR